MTSRKLWRLFTQPRLSPSQPYLDSHVQVAEFAQVVIGDPAGVGPMSSAQQPMLVQFLADLSFHLRVLGDQVQQPGSTVPSGLETSQEEDADL